MQASREKPNYEKGSSGKGSCGFHIDDKYAKKKTTPMPIGTMGKYLLVTKVSGK
jgi:hypothetical protein